MRHAPLSAVIFTLPLSCAAVAWNPAAPTTLISGASEQVQPKVRPAPNGGFFMSCYDNSTGGYDPTVQRFGSQGTPLWPTPVKVANTSFSSTEDYGFAVDPQGNSIIVFRDDRFGTVQVTAQKLDPSGAALWGANGIQLTTNSAADSSNAPKAGITSDGAFVAGWTQNGKATLIRLNSDGSFAWPSKATITDGTSASIVLADLQPGENGSIIASTVRSLNFSAAKILYAQKYTAAGAAAWPGFSVKLFTTGSLQFGNYPGFVPDGAGGALFAWYTSSPLQCWVQRVDSAGSVLWGSNGTAVTTTTTGKDRTDPSIAYDATSDTLYVSWFYVVPSTSNFGVEAQAFNGAGVRQWGSSALTVVPTETTYSYTQARTVLLGGKPTFGWVKSTAFGQDSIRWQRYDSGGTAQWGSPVEIAPAPGNKARLAPLALGNWMVSVWEDGATGSADLLAQRLNADGTKGAFVPAGDINGDGVVDGADLGLLLGAWGSSPGNPADLNGDGVVDGADLGILLGTWP